MRRMRIMITLIIVLFELARVCGQDCFGYEFCTSCPVQCGGYGCYRCAKCGTHGAALGAPKLESYKCAHFSTNVSDVFPYGGAYRETYWQSNDCSVRGTHRAAN